MVFYSKISYTLLIVVFIVFFAPVISNIYFGNLNTISRAMLVFLVVLYGFILYLFFNITYRITKDMLHVKVGFVSYKPIAISSIKKISNSSNIISSPAASFDRLEIAYGKFDELIISPKEKHKFAAALKRINPNIIVNI